MTKVDIISGFLGAGKTTLIKKLIAEVFAGQQIVLIENEFGEIGIDGGFLKDAGINITEMNSGCICCSLVGDFATALKKVVDEYHPDRIIIEPSGVGKLSDVERAVLDVADEAGIEIATATTVVDAKKAKMYMKNFGEFFNNQVETARCVVLSRTQDVTADKLEETVKLIREKNHEAAVITTPWDDIEGSVIFGAMSDAKALEHELELEHDHHHHHHDDEDEECECGHHHHDHEHDHDD
ncbi:MAG: GTP-binding protein, partial [Lachnospiraceae bacterium]|nr:GTP-binding protein [Lachnospiraceae bacterium]